MSHSLANRLRSMQTSLQSLPTLVRHQGWRWVFYRARHALQLRCGWYRRQLPLQEWRGRSSAQLLIPKLPADSGHRLGSEQAVREAERVLAGELTWFSRHAVHTGFPPDWGRTPFGRHELATTHWSQISDFAGGDIKHVWELGRFSFLLPLLRAWSHSGDDRYVEAIWAVVDDWRTDHPPQRGPHWKCGQEVAFRVLIWSIVLSRIGSHPISNQTRLEQLAEMVEVSGQRIAANLDYALSQKNNHGVSEAAGLFTAGILLGRSDWAETGRRLLNELAKELIYDDGSFSQHSANYHRLMLHCYLWSIQIGRAHGCELRQESVERVAEAGRWLRTLLLGESGQVPNLGHNDGAHLFDLTDLGYRDFRPTVQATGAIAAAENWLPPGPWDELAAWLGVPNMGTVAETRRAPLPAQSDLATSSSWTELADGGYCIYHDGDRGLLLRAPRRFRHRPSQCDLLHVDLWHRGRNLLRDGGSYSYNCDEPWQSYFASSAAHNTVRFDDRDPMPRIQRFLFGEWPTMTLERRHETISARYCDYRGACHQRTVEPTAAGFRVTDELDGDFETAILRWRLAPESRWSLDELACRSSELVLSLTVEPESNLTACELSEGWESNYYQEKTPLPVLETRVSGGPTRIVTEVLLPLDEEVSLNELAESGREAGK